MRHLRLVVFAALAVFAAQALAAPLRSPVPPGRQGKKAVHKKLASPARAGVSAKAPLAKGVVAPEFKMNTDSLLYYQWRDAPAAALQEDGTIISVWSDYRNGEGNVFFQRFTLAGQPMGPCVPVDFQKCSQQYPAVAVGDNGTIAILWQDYRSGTGYDLYCRLFSPSGAPLDTAFRINESSGIYYPAVIHTDSGFVAGWSDARTGGWKVYLQKLDTLGHLKGSNIAASAVLVQQEYTNLAGTGRGFVLSWGNGSNNYTRPFSHNCDTLGPETMVNDVSTFGRYLPKACGTDSGFSVVWYDYRNGSYYDVYMQRYDTAGTKIGANYKVTSTGTHSIVPDIAGSNGRTAVTWIDQRNGHYDVYSQWFKPNGDTLGGQLMLNDTSGQSVDWPKVVAGDSGWAFVWLDERNNWTRMVYGQSYDTSLAATGANFMACDSTFGMNDQYYPAAAAGQSGNFLAVWQDYRNHPSTNISDIYGRLYSKNGAALTPDFLISDTSYNSTSRNANEPKVAGLSDGSYIVAWYDYRNNSSYEVYGQLVSSAGSPAGGNFLISTSNTGYDDYELAVAAGDSGFGVCWYGYDSSGSYYDLYGRIFKTNGDSVGPTLIINDIPDQDCEYPSLAANDSGLVAVWQDYRDDNYYHIYGQRLRWDGTLYGGNYRIGDSLDNDQYEPSLAGANNGFMLTWYDSRNGNDAIFGQYLDARGQKVDTNFIVSTNAGISHAAPSVASSPDGSRYAVFWYANDGYSDFIFSQRYQDGQLQGINEMVNDSIDWGGAALWGGQGIAATEDRLFFSWYGQNGQTGNDAIGKITDWYANALPPVVWLDSLPDDIDSAYGPYTVKAKITDDGSVDQVMFYYQINGGAWDTLNLTTGLADTFIAVIPAQSLSTGDTVDISYYAWALDDTKNFISSPARSFKLIYPTGVTGQPGSDSPKIFALQPCWPNPSSGRVSFGYQLPKASNVSLTVYNITGQVVKRFDQGTKPAGRHQIDWNGDQVSAGIYFYRLQAGEFTATRKLMIVK